MIQIYTILKHSFTKGLTVRNVVWAGGGIRARTMDLKTLLQGVNSIPAGQLGVKINSAKLIDWERNRYKLVTLSVFESALPSPPSPNTVFVSVLQTMLRQYFKNRTCTRWFGSHLRLIPFALDVRRTQPNFVASSAFMPG